MAKASAVVSLVSVLSFAAITPGTTQPLDPVACRNSSKACHGGRIATNPPICDGNIADITGPKAENTIVRIDAYSTGRCEHTAIRLSATMTKPQKAKPYPGEVTEAGDQRNFRTGYWAEAVLYLPPLSEGETYSFRWIQTTRGAPCHCVTPDIKVDGAAVSSGTRP